MRNRARICIGIFTGTFFLFVFALAFKAQAQTAEQEWSVPVNLSQSGAATEAQAVVSSDGVLHVLWLDAFNGFVHTQGDGETLAEPVPAEFPFGREIILLNGGSTRTAYTPLLSADNNGRIHAFWTDDEGALFYSRVIAAEFQNLESWTAQQQLGEAALAYDVAIAADDIIHLAYIRPISTAEFPAGVYYRRSGDGGTTWSNPFLLYQSPYFRSLSPQAARIDLEATDTGEVIIAWDNRPEERVFIIRSPNSGGTWEEPAEIDSRQNDDLDTAIGPSNISVAYDGSAIHLFWQAGHEAFLCAQYHQWSLDGGATWQRSQRILSEFEGCSQENNYFVVPGGLVLISVYESGVYTQFWDGSRWGELKRHGVLTSFSNPSTFRTVDLGCRTFTLLNGRVYVIGCDTSTNNDIWKISSSLENLIPSETTTDAIWTGQNLVVNQEEGQTLEAPVLVADADGRIHALWSQKNDSGSTINYIVSEGDGWSDPLDVLASPGGGSASEDPAAIYYPGGQLMVVWDNGVGGEVYFSRVPTALAGSAAEWFEPELMPAQYSTAGSPDIAYDADGRIYVVYALTLNEDRGVYIVTSDDQGESWSDPRLIFDGVEAGWDAVDNPKITVTGDGFLHVIWTQRSFPPANIPLSTAYAASTDGGESWSDVTDLPFADVPPVWSEISASGLQTLHRVWQEDFEGFSNYWSQLSNDSGLNWEQPVRISDRNNLLGEAALAVDGSGRPHLLQLAGFGQSSQSGDGASPLVQHWAWSDGGWVEGEGFNTQAGPLGGADGIAAAVVANGNLAVLFSGLSLNVETGRLQPGYLVSSRSLSLDLSTPTPGPTITATLIFSETTAGTPIPSPEPTVQPTPTIFFPTETEDEGGFSLPFIGSLGGLAAIIPIGLIVLMVVLVSVRFVRGSQG